MCRRKIVRLMTSFVFPVLFLFNASHADERVIYDPPQRLPMRSWKSECARPRARWRNYKSLQPSGSSYLVGGPAAL
jgi:hypothetical protein